jgi:hypothetical protein
VNYRASQNGSSLTSCAPAGASRMLVRPLERSTLNMTGTAWKREVFQWIALAGIA